MKLEPRTDIAEVMELGVGSPAKLKILRLLLRNPQHAFTMYELERKTPLKAVDIRRHVTELVRIGWVKGLPLRPKKYAINLDNALVKHLEEFFRKIEYT